MQKYCNIVKNKLDTLIQNMEGNVSAFVADPKRDFVRKSELSFSKTMKFILGIGSQTLGKELMEFYDYDSKMVSVSAIVQQRAKILPAAFQYLFHKLNDSPDLAIAFNEGTVKHIYFIAETKGSMSSIDLRPIEKAKIDCAKVLFNKMKTNDVQYEVVKDYKELLNIVSQ